MIVMHDNVRTFVAEASAIQSSDLYMTVSMVMFEAERANLNGVRVTEAFIDEVVANQDKYITLPLVVDTKMLYAHGQLGHKYDPRTDTFDTTIIGAFYKFEKKVEADIVSLVGYARISKRDQETCNAVAELFAENKLKFSFEIACHNVAEQDDGTCLIDADVGNYLTSLCIVSQPACPNAVAMQLVAEKDNEEAEVMPNEVIETAEAVVETAELAQETTEVVEVASTEESTISSEPEEASTTAVAESSEEPEEEKKEEKEEEKECAETEDEKKETEETCASKEEDKPEEVEKAECKEEEKEETAECDEEKEKELREKEEDAACKKKAEVDVDALMAEINSLKDIVAGLTSKITELAEAKEEKIVAEVEVKEEKNPFLAEDFGASTKYSLLESETRVGEYTLI